MRRLFSIPQVIHRISSGFAIGRKKYGGNLYLRFRICSSIKAGLQLAGVRVTRQEWPNGGGSLHAGGSREGNTGGRAIGCSNPDVTQTENAGTRGNGPDRFGGWT